MMPIPSVWSRVPQAVCRHAETSRTRVLVVEDDLLVGLVAAEALEQAGFIVLTAGSAEEANVILAEEAIDVLFTDIDWVGWMDAIRPTEPSKHGPGLL